MNASISGRSYPAGQSRATVAELRVRPGRSEHDVILELVAPEGRHITSAPLREVTVDPPLGRAARRITFPDHIMFETDDHDGVERVTGMTRGSLLHSYEQFRPRLIGVVAAIVAGIWALWRYGLDLMAAAAVALTPPVLVEQIDRGTLLSMDLAMVNQTALSDDQKARARHVFDVLVDALDDDVADRFEFTLLFRDAPGMGPNAFALPGGTVVMTDAFVRTFGNDDVLAGVLGHELGHVVEQHGLRQVYRSLSIYVLVAFLAGDTGPILEDVLLEGNLLLSLSFSRKHERDADQFGLRLARDAGFDPAGLRQFFEQVEKRGAELPEWLSSHPSSTNRLGAIDEFIRENR